VARANAAVVAANAEAKAAVEQMDARLSSPMVAMPLPMVHAGNHEAAAGDSQRRDAALQEFQLRTKLANLGKSRGSSRSSSPTSSSLSGAHRSSIPTSPARTLPVGSHKTPESFSVQRKMAGLRMMRQAVTRMVNREMGVRIEMWRQSVRHASFAQLEAALVQTQQESQRAAKDEVTKLAAALAAAQSAAAAAVSDAERAAALEMEAQVRALKKVSESQLAIAAAEKEVIEAAAAEMSASIAAVAALEKETAEKLAAVAAAKADAEAATSELLAVTSAKEQQQASALAHAHRQAEGIRKESSLRMMKMIVASMLKGGMGLRIEVWRQHAKASKDEARQRAMLKVLVSFALTMYVSLPLNTPCWMIGEGASCRGGR
jgi:hypothetical protein